MTTFEITLAVVNLMMAGPITWLIIVLSGLSKRLQMVEQDKVSGPQMREYVELKQEPMMVMIHRMADDLRQMRRLMEEQANGNRSNKE